MSDKSERFDPSPRTTEQLLRVVQAAEEQLELRVHALGGTVNEKLNTIAVRMEALSDKHDTWVGIVTTQRLEDAKAVEIALLAVEKAAQIHAAAHSQQHNAHQDIHIIEGQAIAKAAAQLDARLAGMNGIRDQLRDQATKFVDANLATVRNDALEKRIELNRHDIEDLRLILATKVGKDETRSETRTEIRTDHRADSNLRLAMIVGLGGLFVSVISLVVAFMLK